MNTVELSNQVLHDDLESSLHDDECHDYNFQDVIGHMIMAANAQMATSMELTKLICANITNVQKQDILDAYKDASTVVAGSSSFRDMLDILN